MAALQARARIIIGTFIDTPTPTELRIRESHLCVISPKGRLLHLAPYDSGQGEEAALRGLPKEWTSFPISRLTRSQFIVPGLVDCHTHSAQYVQLGTKTSGSILEWLEMTLRNEGKCADLPYARNLYTKLVRRMLRNGTTTAQYFATNHLEATKELARICAHMGQRALVGKVCADQHSPDYLIETTEGSIRDTEDFIRWCFDQESGRKNEDMELVSPVITMRSICTLTLLKALGDLASKYDVHVQSHVSETPHSVSMIHEMYPDLGGRDVAVFDSVKLLTRKTCLGHGAYLRDDEVRRMAAVGASVAVCPYSSMLYLQAISPIARWVDLGLTVGLGTDIAAGYNNSMLGVGRLATLANHAESFNNVQRELPSSAAPEAPSADLTRVDWVYAFHLATAGGAAALVLEDKIGKFEVGMQFDALLVDVDVDGQAFEYWEDEPTVKQVERWWNTGDDRNLRSVWVQGRSVLNDLGAKDQ